MQCIINNKTFDYTKETVFVVEVGFKKGAYKPRYSFVGELARAAMYYQSINIGLGYKKRLVIKKETDGKVKLTVLARQFS